METTETEKDNKEKVVMAIMVTEKVVDILVGTAKAIMAVEKAVDIMVTEKAMAIMAVAKAIMVAEKATMVASDSIIAHPIAIGTT